MLLGGDEIDRTQGGNNNGWCQDNEISWFDWDLDEEQLAAAGVHAEADRAAPRAPPLAPARLFHGRRRGRLGPAGRVVVPPGRAAHDATRLERPGHTRRPLPQRRGARGPGPQASGLEDDSFLLLFNARQTTARSPSRAAASGRRTFALELADPNAAPGDGSVARGPRITCRAFSSCAARTRAGVPRDVPPPARPGLTFADARALVPYLRDLGICHLYLSPSFAARAGSTHGYDVVDPTRFSDALGGEAGSGRWPRRRARPGLGIVLDIVPNHMAADDANPYWADPERRRRFFDPDEETGRHRRFFEIDHLAGVRQEDPEVFAETHAAGPGARRARALVDGLRIDHPDGLADPAGYLAALREGAPSTSGWRRSSTPASALRPWPVEGTVGLRVPRRRRGALRRSRRRGAADRALGGAGRRRARLRRVGGRGEGEQVTGPFAPDVEWLRAAASGAGARGGADRAARVPDVPAAGRAAGRGGPRACCARPASRASSTALPRPSSRASSRPRRP